MEKNSNIYESLLESATEYSKTTFELIKLKIIDKTVDVFASYIALSFVFVLITSFVLFISLGLALFLGEILGKIYFGFFIVAAFYGLTAIVLYFLLNNRFKKCVRNFTIKQVLK